MKTAAAMCLLLSGGLIAFVAGAEEGTVYRWVDEDGTPHYQDRPPEGAENAQELSLRYRLSDPEAIAAATSREAEEQEVAQLREAQQAQDQAPAEADRQQILNEREQGCGKARERQQKYETAHRLYEPGPDGQRNYLSDEELDAARLDARKAVEKWCDE
jgi:Domain of unknown function (DUF4124)